LPKKKPYDVDYKVRSLQEIIDMQTTAVSNIQTLLEVSVSSFHVEGR
jgi:ariadne-1